MNKQQEFDAKECEELQLKGKDKDCLGCSCSVCIAQEPDYKKCYDEIKAKNEVYRKYWLELCDKILNEIDKDGWCRLIMTKEKAKEMREIFKELK